MLHQVGLEVALSMKIVECGMWNVDHSPPGLAGFRGAAMAGMPRVSGLLRRGQQLPAAARGFSFTVAGQDSAKVGARLLSGTSLLFDNWQT